MTIVHELHNNYK